MTDHTYAGYTAVQIRAAAEAASPGTWREQRYMSDGKVGYGIVDGGRGLFIGEHRLMPFCETDRRHIVTSQPATVLALLDRIAELEQRVETVEGWHFTETSRADELQESIYGDRDEIAGLRARIAELDKQQRKADASSAPSDWPEDRGEHPQQGLATAPSVTCWYCEGSEEGPGIEAGEPCPVCRLDEWEAARAAKKEGQQ